MTSSIPIWFNQRVRGPLTVLAIVCGLWLLFRLPSTQQVLWASQPPNLDHPDVLQDAPTLLPIHDVLIYGRDGARVDVSKATRPIVLNLFATWCPPCVAELPSLLRLRAQVLNEVDVYIASMEEPELLQSWLHKKDFDPVAFFTIEPQSIHGGLATNSIPMTWIIMPGGQIIRRVPGAHDWSDHTVVSFLRRL